MLHLFVYNQRYVILKFGMVFKKNASKEQETAIRVIKNSFK